MTRRQAFQLAAQIACRQEDRRHHLLGAVGIRKDGVIVTASNGPALDYAPEHHAERRLSHKLDTGATVYVVRVSRANGQLTLARPCPACVIALRAKRVKRVIYSMSSREWGILDLT